jgi:diaminopimelate epimerase
VIETLAGPVVVTAGAQGITADMGEARFDWRDIPLAREMDTLALAIEDGPLRRPTAVSIGNPHAVFFVDDAEAIPLADIGPRLEHHPFYPQRANVEAVEVRGPDRLRVRVWERGAGLTQACGTGACAALVAAHRRGLIGRKGQVELDGGTLTIEWRDDNHVLMTGPAAISFTGDVDLDAYAGVGARVGAGAGAGAGA